MADLEMVDPRTLKAWPGNPRQNARAVGVVAKSITRFGFGAPIVANRREGEREIIAGHTRQLAALKLKMAAVPVRWLDLPPDEAHALSLADNKLGEVATWDEAALAAVLGDLRGQGVVVEDLGFDADALAQILDPKGPDEDPGPALFYDGSLEPKDFLLAPFPYFGGKRSVVGLVWSRLGQAKHYIEPFCGSAAMLLGSPHGAASLEVVNDGNGFIANFWRAVVHQAEAVAHAADYPVSHLDLGARHGWLLEQRQRVGEALQDPLWIGDAQVAGWWLWGQCAWIGSGWAVWDKAVGQVPHAGNAGLGVQAAGQVPHASSAGMGVQAVGRIPHASSAGMGVQAVGQVQSVVVPFSDGFWTSGGRAANVWLARLTARMERVRVVHGDWSRCLNHNYGADNTAVFLDPPYLGYEIEYETEPCGRAVEQWARENPNLKIALCGHFGDYALDGWECVRWKRKSQTYSGSKTTNEEAIWFSPSCENRGVGVTSDSSALPETDDDDDGALDDA